MSYPYDIRIDADGRQIVCEFGNSRLQIFDHEDQLIEVIGGAGSDPGQFSNPWSIALDSQGNIIVADSMNHRVQKLWRRKPAGVALEKPKLQRPRRMYLLPPVKEPSEDRGLENAQPPTRLVRSGSSERASV